MIIKGTEIQETGVAYNVYVDGEAFFRWAVFVAFSGDAAHRAGGPAFVEAAREQDRIAQALAAELA